MAVAYGEVDYVNSDLIVEDYTLEGPGVNTDSVDVTINNTDTNSTTADTTVYLMSDGSEVAQGTVTGTTWNGGQTQTVSVSVSPSVKEFEFDSVDIRVEEQ